jgi:hypothetical protein
VIVMLVMAVLLLAGTTFLTISSTESQIAQNQQASVRAFSLAEAGVHRAIAQLSANSSYAGESDVAFGGGALTVGVAASAQQVCLSKDLTVLASVSVRGGQAQTRLRVTVDRAIYPFQWGLFAANGGLGLLSMDGSEPRTKADSYDSRLGVYNPPTNGGGPVNLGAQGGGVVLYNVDVLGTFGGDWVWITSSTGTNIGPPSESAPALPEPTATWANDPNIGVGGTLDLAAGTHYYAQMTLGNNARLTASGGPATVYVQGNFTAGTGVIIGAESEKLSLIMNSGTGTPAEFRAGHDFRLYGSLYGTNTKVFLGDNSAVFGAIIGRLISGWTPWWGEYQSNTKAPAIHFDRAMMRRPVCTPNLYSIRSGTWREAID